MKLQTKYHGIQEYSEKDVIFFKKGIPGFDNLTKFIIFPVKDNEVFSILHSIEDSNIGLIVTSPFNVMSEYEFKLSDETIKRLKIEKAEDVLVINTVTLSSKPENITINLRAPIIINIKEKLGEQIILNNEKYLIKHPLFKEEL
ncbi:MAG: flagellar assembly protein FliW [Clostridium thermopalmarium]|uniref:flagellar assembly protein FliW n=1 Tax=Clostridium thermopalmarium TaxID=29373 RepID=UPI0023563901|nr:flagellar assembly protein FliW [Clostridium thermopalmarium]MBE6044695.1 flagellar assembly protein FliW [Clostridium thermopalmarium]